MTTIKLDKLGMPGVSYKFAGNIKKLVFKSGEEVSLNTDPWKVKPGKLAEISKLTDKSVSIIENVFIELQDSMRKEKPKPSETIQGKNTGKVVTGWEDVVKVDANGNPNGLNTEAIATLLAPGHARIDDVIFQVENNIGDMMSEEKLKIAIISGLKTVGAADMYAMNTYKLVRDQLLPIIPVAKLGEISGHLPCKNGVLDICKGEVIETDDIYLKTLNIPFDAEAKDCPKITEMLDNMFLPEQKEMVLSILGAAISGKRSPFILALSGAGRNGKSLLREILEAMMMDLITTEKLENLNKDFVNSVFLGKRISWQTEVNSSRKLLDQIKDVTGGTTIQVRRKFINGELQYALQMVCVIDTNSPPHFDDSAAINDRMRFVNMPHQFVYELSGAPNEMLINPNLVNGWKEELPAFLNMLLPYARYFIENGRLMHDITGTSKQLRDRSDLISNFIDEYCDPEDEGSRTTMTKFYNHFSQYAKSMNVAVPEKSAVSYKLRTDYGLRVKSNVIHGLAIREQRLLSTE